MKFLKNLINCAAVLSCTLALTACGSNGILAPKAPDLNKQFDMTADVVWGDSSFSLNMSRISAGSWQVMINEPYEVQGVIFSYSKDRTTAVLDGIGIDGLTSDFGCSPIAAIINAIENAVQDTDASVTYLDGGYRVSSKDCILSFEQGNSAPVEFEIPKEKISGKVNNFTVKGELSKEGTEVTDIW